MNATTPTYKDYHAWWNRRRAHNEITLTAHDFITLWQGKWHLRGNKKHSLVLSRIDLEGIYEASNLEVITRQEASKKASKYRLQGATPSNYKLTKIGWTPAKKAAQAKAMKEYWTPEHREAHGQAVREAWTRRRRQAKEQQQ